MRILTCAIVLVGLVSSTRASAADADESARPPPARHPPSVSLSLAGGASTSSFLGLPTRGVSLGAALGIETGGGAFPISAAFHLGTTEGGLRMAEGRLGFVPQLVLGRLRLGAGGEVGHGRIARVAARADDIAYWTFDLTLSASVDLVRFGGTGGAVYVCAQPSGGVRWGESVFALGDITPGWRMTGLAGVRF